MKYAALLLFVILGITALHAQRPVADYRRAGSSAPPFVLHKPGGGTVTGRVLRPGKPFMFVIFSPQCDHCALALDSLRSIPELRPLTDMVLVVEARNKPFLKEFMAKHRFDTVAAFRHTGFVSGQLIQRIYNFGMLPQFSVYDRQHRFVKSFSGLFPLDSLKPYLR